MVEGHLHPRLNFVCVVIVALGGDSLLLGSELVVGALLLRVRVFLLLKVTLLKVVVDARDRTGALTMLVDLRDALNSHRRLHSEALFIIFHLIMIADLVQ